MANEVSVKVRQRKLTSRGGIVRETLLRTTANLLTEFGYGGTTFHKLSVHSGVSHGSILHQFPDRYALMEAVSGFIVEGMAGAFASRFSEVHDPWMRLEMYPDVISEVASSPLALAFMEIQLAARWDEHLATQIQPQLGRLRQMVYGPLADNLAELGVEDLETVSARIYALGSAGQGFALDLNIYRSGRLSSLARTIVKEDFRRAIADLRTRDGPEGAAKTKKKGRRSSSRGGGDSQTAGREDIIASIIG